MIRPKPSLTFSLSIYGLVAVAPTIKQSRPLLRFFLFRLKFKVSLSSTRKNLFKNTLEIHVYSAKSPKITTESTNMRSERKASISGLAGTEHARNRTLPDLPFRMTVGDLGTRLAIGHFGIAQGTGASFKFKPIDKLTPSLERR